MEKWAKSVPSATYQSLNQRKMTNPISRTDYLTEEKNLVLKDIVRLEVDLGVMTRTDPKTLIAKRVKKDKDGRVISSEDVYPEGMIKEYTEELTGKNLRLLSISALLAKEEKVKKSK